MERTNREGAGVAEETRRGGRKEVKPLGLAGRAALPKLSDISQPAAAMSPQVNHYPVQPGLYAGEYPGHPSPNVAETRLRELVDRGVQTFIDLTTPEDAAAGLLPYEPLFGEVDEEGAAGLKRYSFPIPDMGIPTGRELMRGVLDLIRAEIAAGRTCYLHCWGGIGRTGTAVACWLREAQGLDAAAALAEVQRLYDAHMDESKRARYPRSPQQAAQLKYVEEWGAERSSK